MSALAEKGNRVEEIFVTDKVNEAGIYTVKLFVNGEEHLISVDDYFPFEETPEADRWAFSRVNRREHEIWPLILEKAQAKIYGSYERFEGGKPY